MKTRQGFVSNSSSSSFLLITSEDDEIFLDADYSKDYEGETSHIDIDKLMSFLTKEKEKGNKTIDITYGAYYDY